MQETKHCNTCHQDKAVAEFYLTIKNGKPYRPTKCKTCSKERAKKQKEYYVPKHYRDLQSKLKNLVTKARNREKSFDDSLTASYLETLWNEQGGKCVYSGLPLELEAKHPHSVSLDRKDSNMGYCAGNVQLVSASVNRMKQEYSEEFFLDLCNRITNNRSKMTPDDGPAETDPRSNTPDERPLC